MVANNIVLPRMRKNTEPLRILSVLVPCTFFGTYLETILMNVYIF